MGSSFAPKDFSSGRWQGGHAVIQNVMFKYDSTDFGRGAGKEQVVNLTMEFLDDEGMAHPSRYMVGGVNFNNQPVLAIKDGPDEDADAADEGPSIGHVEKDKDYKVSPNSEAGLFFSHLVAAGFSESKLVGGDVTVLDGLDVEVVAKPKKEGDKFHILLVSKVNTRQSAKAGTGASAKTSASGKASASMGASRKSGNGASDAATEKASEIIMTVLEDGGGKPVLVSDAVRRAVSELKGNPLKGDVVALFSDAAFLSKGNWIFDSDDRTLMQA